MTLRTSKYLFVKILLWGLDKTWSLRHRLRLRQCQIKGFIKQLKTRQTLDQYGHSLKPKNKTEELHILFRSCTRISINAAARPCNATKRETVMCSLQSLLDSITPACTVHILDDHSPVEDVFFMKAMLAKSGERHKFITIQQTGNGNSLEANYRYAKDHKFKLMYFCEDDYLHLPEAIPSMLKFYEEFSHDCIIHPTDYTDRYIRDDPYPSLLFLGKDRHWRTIRHTTGTLLLSQRILQIYWDLYIGFAEYNKKTNGGEDLTINRIYESELCVSPIPSLAAHFNYAPPMPPFQDWEKLFIQISHKIKLRKE